MTRPLLIVAALGFLSCMVCFSIAMGMGPLNWDEPGFWAAGRDRGPAISPDGPEITRTIAWTGGDELNVNIGADVTYTQGPASTIVITGPKGAVDNVVLDDGDLNYERRMRPRPHLKIVMTAPDVEEFGLRGSQTLKIVNYDRAKLQISIFGSGRAEAAGKADRLELNIAGSGDVDLRQLDLADAEVNIAGSGDATLGPKDSAEVHIAGSGDVILTTRPTRLETKIAGSGKIRQDDVTAAPPAPAAPANTAAPAKTAA